MGKQQILAWDLPLRLHRSRDVQHPSWRLGGGHEPAYHAESLIEEGEGYVMVMDSLATIEQLPAIVANRLEQALQVQRLEETVSDLAERVRLVETSRSVASRIAEIQTFAPEPYQLLAPIRVTLETDGHEGCLASFFDANISTTGDTEQEAFDNLKNLILDVFDSLGKERPERLGPEPRRQLEVLRSLIRGA